MRYVFILLSIKSTDFPILFNYPTTLLCTHLHTYIHTYMLSLSKQISIQISGSVRGVMVIVVGNAYGDTSSNPGRD